MKHGKRFTGFLLLQNMMLKDFVRQGLVDQSLRAEEVERLSQLATLNAQEIARWGRDLCLPDDRRKVGLEGDK